MKEPHRCSLGEAVSKLKLTDLQRIFRKIKQVGDCWVWQGAKRGQGYGKVWINGRHQRVHRVMFAAFKEESLEGMDVHHTCHTLLCVNPDHLEAALRSDNIAEGNSWRRDHGATTEIPF